MGRTSTMKRVALVLLTVALLPAAAPAAGPNLDQLIGGLGGGDEQARIVARQLLPRFGAAAVSRLLPLVASDDANVWNAAMRVLEDIANTVSVPGREAERLETVRLLMTLVAADRPDFVKERGLRLLPLAVPEGCDVGPVAALLDSNALIREKARAALRDIGTDNAAAALCDALPRADAEFQCALLDALGPMGKPASEPAIAAALQSPEARVRAAAARALSWTGDPRHIGALWAVYRAADDITRFDAGDAIIRLGNVMGQRGGHWRDTMSLFQTAAAEFADLQLKGASLAGLGAYGDESVIPVLLAALEGKDGRQLEPAVLTAFAALQGPGADHALLEVFPAVSRDMQVSLLGIFGNKRKAQFLPLLSEFATNSDPVLRAAALNGLGATRLPGALPPLIQFAESCTTEEKPAARENLRRMADTLRNAGEREGASRAFLALYRLAESEEDRLLALEGVKQFPVPEAFELIMGAVGGDELDTLPVGTLAGVAQALLDAGRADEAKKVVDLLLPRIATTEEMKEALGPLMAAGMSAEQLGVIRSWSLAGPFPSRFEDGFAQTFIGEPNVDLTATYAAGDATLSWTQHETGDAFGVVNLMAVFGMVEDVSAYGYAEVAVAEAADVVVRAGSDDGIKVWVNGEAAHENNADRGNTFDQDQAPAHLKAGVNAILVRCTQHLGGWNFHVRLTTPDGAPLPFERVTQ